MANHADLVAATKAALEARGVDLSGACGAFAITKRVAWALRSEGAGLLDKPAGNNCEGYATDIIAYPDGSIVDILGDAGGANNPGWDVSPSGSVSSSRYRPPVEPGDAVPAPPEPPAPPAPPAPPPFDLAAAFAALATQQREDTAAIIDKITRLRQDVLDAAKLYANPLGRFLK